MTDRSRDQAPTIGETIFGANAMRSVDCKHTPTLIIRVIWFGGFVVRAVEAIGLPKCLFVTWLLESRMDYLLTGGDFLKSYFLTQSINTLSVLPPSD